jgi:general secretion pathway protein D
MKAFSFLSLQRLGVLVAFLCVGTSSLFAQARGGGAGGGGVGGGGAGGAGGAGGSVSATRQYQNSTLIGDAIITSDVDARQIIVVTDDMTEESIRAIIKSLDRPKPQVLIDVVFLQVTHDNDLDLGVDASYKGPISIKTNPDGEALTRFGVTNQFNDPTSNGLFYRILGRDVTATIHALSSVNKTEILSRPTVLARSNQQATILVGQSVPIITGSQVAAQTGSVTNTFDYQDVGIILRVTPFVTADGLVEMILAPEISSISATTVAISQTVSLPVIERRSADTVVVTRSDKTVVIGGLISTEKGDQENKVPILGSIPILGNAFKRTRKGNTKTELLIFLTPRVINHPDDLDRVTDGERARLNLAPQAFDKADIGKFLQAPVPAPVK